MGGGMQMCGLAEFAEVGDFPERFWLRSADRQLLFGMDLRRSGGYTAPWWPEGGFGQKLNPRMALTSQQQQIRKQEAGVGCELRPPQISAAVQSFPPGRAWVARFPG